MKLKQIVFLPQNIAEQLVPLEHWALISIRCPGDPLNLCGAWWNILELQFDDIEKTHHDWVSFSYEQADETIKFLEIIERTEKVDTLIVHCAAGISRSTAVAQFAQKHYSTKPDRILLGSEKHNKLVLSMLEYQLKNRKNTK